VAHQCDPWYGLIRAIRSHLCHPWSENTILTQTFLIYYSKQKSRTNMSYNYSKNLQKIIESARTDAVSLGQNYINTEHLFLGILKNPECTAYEILLKLGLNVDRMQQLLENRLRMMHAVANYGHIPLTKRAERVLKMTYLESRKLNNTHLSSGHLLLAIMKEAEELSSDILLMNDISYEQIRAEMMNRQNFDGSYEVSDVKEHAAKSETPILDNFGQDFTKLAQENKLDPVIGRDDEIMRVAQILSRRKKNNPVLIGEPGVGKTAIVEGLAIKIIQNDVPHSLLNKRIVNIDLGNLISGTKFRGQFEERIKGLMEELIHSKDIIIFIDELHVLVGAGSAQGSLDAANLFKPSLARGEIHCIGATTYDEYKKHIEKDGALERRFQKVVVNPPSIEETRTILHSLKKRYEDHHRVRYTDPAVDACVHYSEKYITDKFLPDKAFDLLDEAGAHVSLMNFDIPKEVLDLHARKDDLTRQKNEAIRSQDYELAARIRDSETLVLEEITVAEKNVEERSDKQFPVVDENIVADIVTMMTGIPVQKVVESEAERYLKIHDELRKWIVGQDEAITTLGKSIRRTRAGLKNPNRPIGSFLFLGPTGVGKTELAKVLARYLFNDQSSLIKLDMSEYSEKFTVSRLIGAPPGYVGFEEGGMLTEKVRKRPYSVVLFDEIEKAHDEIYNILLQIMDEGVLTDSNGRRIDFKNTIIILTSNIGTRAESAKGIGFSNASDESRNDDQKNLVNKIVRRAFNPEFLNRLDSIIVFNSLKQENIRKIVTLQVAELSRRLFDKPDMINISTKAVNHIVSLCNVENTGAREVRRVIQNLLEDNIAEQLLRNTLLLSKPLSVDYVRKEMMIKN